MDSIYFEDPLGLLIELASYRFEPPDGFTHAEVLFEAPQAAASSAETTTSAGPSGRRHRSAGRRTRASLSEDRSPKKPYPRRKIDGRRTRSTS